jgi:hypothetical protein
MNKQLSETQINSLFLFCEQEEVRYYDVQIELVDHLASGIEQKCAQCSEMSFDEALWSVFDDFGPAGFSRVKDMKERALYKKYNKVQWSHIADFFKLPKVILTLAGCFAMYLVFRQIDGDYRIVFSIYAPIFLSALVYYPLYLKKNFRVEINADNDFALLDHLEQLKGQFMYHAIFPPLNVFIWGHLLLQNVELSTTELFIRDALSALFFVFWILLMYIFGYYLPNRVVADFRNEFPQFCVD